jgi:hypothetical protein
MAATAHAWKAAPSLALPVYLELAPQAHRIDTRGKEKYGKYGKGRMSSYVRLESRDNGIPRKPQPTNRESLKQVAQLDTIDIKGTVHTLIPDIAGVRENRPVRTYAKLFPLVGVAGYGRRISRPRNKTNVDLPANDKSPSRHKAFEDC